MRIEIPTNNRMSMTGKSIIESLQNKSMSNIDLLVRESIQNSLDAYRKDKAFKNIVMSYNTGQFNSRNLCNELDLLGNQLNTIYGSNDYDYISIEDKNTVGLNGEISVVNQNGEYGNFQKLVYEIAKPQTDTDAGGSWGYGKTVYYRVGMGLVVYYTRFKDINGRYKERLACTYIEDETNSNSLLSKIQPDDNRGIAWLGKYDIDNITTIPIENIQEIHDFLSVFEGIVPYYDEDTGTKIIIPYLNKRELLDDINSKRDDSELDNYYSWMDNFEETLKNSIQCWYAPRLNNTVYKECYNKPFLKVVLNGKTINFNFDDNPFFSIVNRLYKCAISNNYNTYINNEDVVEVFESGIIVQDVTYSKLRRGEKAGSVAFAKVKKDKFNQGYVPYVYLGKHNNADTGNRPIICFTRMPGMIVNYQLSNEWADKLPSTDDDEYLIGIFVLNSNATFKKNDMLSIEEYVRASEMADHTSWEDLIYKKVNYGKVISTICKNVQRVIKDTYVEDDNIAATRVVGISQKLGRIFLPSKGFGNKPITGLRKTPTNTNISKHKSSSICLSQPYGYDNNSVKVDFHLELRNKYVKIEPMIVTVSGVKDREYWVDNMGSDFPFEFKELIIKEIREKNSKDNTLEREIIINNIYEGENLDIYLNSPNDNYFESFRIENGDNKSRALSGTITVLTNTKDFSFSIKMKKGDN